MPHRAIPLLLLLLLLGVGALGFDVGVRPTLERPAPLLQVSAPAEAPAPVTYGPFGRLYDIRESLFLTLPIPRDAVVFLGDSMTSHAEWNELFPGIHALNRGIAGDTVAGVLHRLDDITLAHPAAVVLMVGVNDLRQGRPVSEIVGTYQQVLERLVRDAPTTRVIVQGVLRTNDAMLRVSLPGNDNVAALNRALRELAGLYGLPFVDLNVVLAPEGALRAELTVDGLHLNGTGYGLWRDAIADLLPAAGS